MMRMPVSTVVRASFCALLLLQVTLRSASTQTSPPLHQLQSQIDSVFASFQRADAPGCAVAVDRAGELRFARGYGLASIEHDVPIGPQSRFYAASVSKQFAAASIALLVADGKLSLDDDVRLWIPEVPDVGERITVRHLLHHTSGLRDYFGLLMLTGWPSDGPLTETAFLGLVSRQKALNFAPGEQYLYSNTGYVLLSILVQRASGRSLRAFAAERIFAPLEMRDSDFRDDHRDPVMNGASAYERTGGGTYRTSMPGFDVVGDGGLFTTVEDLLRWARNFEYWTVGGDVVREMMLTRGVLRSGDTISYAFGIVHGEYRGAPILEHGGAYGGYRTHLVIVPAERLAVATLCNTSEANAQALSRRVVDVVAGDRLQARVAMQSSAGAEDSVTVTEGELARYVGNYWSERTETLLRLAAERGTLLITNLGAPMRLVPLGGGRFRFPFGAPTLVFHVSEGSAAQLEQIGADGEIVRYTRMAAPAPSHAVADLAGRYSSAELGVSWTLRAVDGRLVLSTPTLPDEVLEPAFTDGFTMRGNLIRFVRDGTGRATHFTLSAGRIRGIRFDATPDQAATMMIDRR